MRAYVFILAAMHNSEFPEAKRGCACLPDQPEEGCVHGENGSETEKRSISVPD